MYLMRLDDASEYMDLKKWERMEKLLDNYNIKPIFGIIPNNKDIELLKYEKIDDFWLIMRKWKNKGWIPALHGYTHVFETDNAGINPVNNRSEFAGVSYECQCQKIKNGIEILKKNGIEAKIFFAPAHTFDNNTLRALKDKSEIRIISDTIANDIYYKDEFYYIPQQSGECRELPFKTVTFCYHPNLMTEKDYIQLEKFLSKHKKKFSILNEKSLIKRKFSFGDMLLRKLYFARRRS